VLVVVAAPDKPDKLELVLNVVTDVLNWFALPPSRSASMLFGRITADRKVLAAVRFVARLDCGFKPCAGLAELSTDEVPDPAVADPSATVPAALFADGLNG
jgi:hypothetical protein